MDERDLDLVAAAFDRLLAYMTQESDQTVTWTIAAAKGDILDILAGQWRADEMTQEEAGRVADLMLDAGLLYGDGLESAAYALRWGQS